MTEWRYVHASVRGTSHITDQIPCQDFSIVRMLEKTNRENLLVLVVADGAGSVTHSHEGAELVCSLALNHLNDYVQQGGKLCDITQKIVAVWINELSKIINDLATKYERVARDYATTLLLAAVGSEEALFLQIGDGAIVINTETGYKPVFWPMSGEYANTTCFVTDPAATDNIQFTIIYQPITEIALFSDGLQMLALQYQQREAFTPFFTPMFARLRQEPPGLSALLTTGLTEFLNSPPVNERTDDDKTLILATRRTD